MARRWQQVSKHSFHLAEHSLRQPNTLTITGAIYPTEAARGVANFCHNIGFCFLFASFMESECTILAGLCFDLTRTSISCWHLSNYTYRTKVIQLSLAHSPTHRHPTPPTTTHPATAWTELHVSLLNILYNDIAILNQEEKSQWSIYERCRSTQDPYIYAGYKPGRRKWA